MTRLEERLRDALFATALQVEESPDLFARIRGSIEDDARRRAWRRKMASVCAAGIAVFLGLLFAVSEHGEGGIEMSWWIFEIAVTTILVVLVILLGPFIKRFGKSYAAEVFRSNPGTGKSFIVLMDIAYYLIFGAYVLLTLVFELPEDWAPTVGGAQLKVATAKIAGILLIMGVLHSLNLLILPIIGRLLTLNRQLDHLVGKTQADSDGKETKGGSS